MEGLGQYILSVVSAALIAGIISSMTSSKGTVGALIRMLCGLFMVFTVIAPARQLDYGTLTAFSREYLTSGDRAAAQGEELAREAMCELIKEETEAYILDKAAQYHAELSVEVDVESGENPVPGAVRLKGSISPYAKQQMEKILETELGIPKENQRWIS